MELTGNLTLKNSEFRAAIGRQTRAVAKVTVMTAGVVPGTTVSTVERAMRVLLDWLRHLSGLKRINNFFGWRQPETISTQKTNETTDQRRNANCLSQIHGYSLDLYHTILCHHCSTVATFIRPPFKIIEGG